MTEKIITDNREGIIRIKWDGTRFALVSKRKGNDLGWTTAMIILNPREMMDIVQFASNLGGK